MEVITDSIASGEIEARVAAHPFFAGMNKHHVDLLARYAKLVRFKPGEMIFQASKPADGRFVNVVSDPAIYVHEWASFSTRDFPANRLAKSGDRVRIIMLDVPDKRPVEDVVCSDADYRRMYLRAGLVVHEMPA